MVDAVVTVFLEKLLKALAEESRVLSEYRDQFERLKGELLFMQSFLQDADRLKRKFKILRAVLVALRDLIYEAEDILADCQSHSEDDDGGEAFKCCSICFRPSKLPFRYLTGKRLKEINEKITKIKQDIISYVGPLLSTTTYTMEAHENRMARGSSPLYDHTQVVGLEGDKQKIKGWLLEANDGILAIGVVGMGGLGKTTIVQEVFNDRSMEDRLERRIWVSVSQTFTEEYILRSILRSLGDASVGDDQTELLKKINQYLLGKRYLIVMDDVWDTNNSWWSRIYQALPKGNGSSVIVTTRKEKVARMMGVTEARTHWPKFLDEDDSWLLFRKIAFAPTQGICNHPELVNVGKDIVQKCKGLPLAIKAVGGVMLCKDPYYHEWKRIADHFRDELAENDDSVMASLQLSYDELPPYLKSCFLCLSLYPEDCVISKEQLIHWWMGVGFVPLRSSRMSTEAGENCFSELTNRCLIEVVDKAYSGMIHTCKTHDMVRDLVIQIAKDDAFSIPCDANCRHLGIRSDMNGKYFIGNQKLRALLTTTRSGEVNKIASNIAKNFCECQHLQVLDLSKSIFEMPLAGLLDQIGSLQHLTYLSLSNTHPLLQVPPSLEKLHKLQILDVSYCQNLRMLPSCILTFEKLTVVDVSHCGSLEYLPKGLGRLSNLQELLGFKPARPSQLEGCRIAELRMLTQLRKLSLRLSQGDEIGDDEVNVLVNLQQLQFLTISCFGSNDNDLILKLDRLSPPQRLHELCLKFYPGKVSPIWLNPLSLPFLRYLSICSGNLAKMNERFWGNGNTVWRIEGLMLEALSDLSEEWSVVQQAMPSLRRLNISWCPELESFPVEGIGFKGGTWKKEENKN
ncbi:disease resistance RPP13-like protein 4 [Cornus florida]|uniref:disease resistance RPP13-like protein 4 n=1 Tax=Cornus florida TaxID=4283 RepID=UPI0028A0885F|nr:disease resistance RPP13-like protein 4 [Cornus florida]XP_059623591.1 disease resistance RPP13-like protein 4 [Cornus florida]XP_059623592.1 disease resistance RPP13-like protein 4 [Cornus florida]XP_059623593.1 disease resistance RPP13-like protein 4 [Cornus florida]